MNTRSRVAGQWLRTGLLAACIAATGVASAADVDTRSVAVRYSDLNLSNPEGVARLYTRIRRAAGIVCGTAGGVDTYFLKARKECRTRAIDDAVKSVNNRILTAMHQQKTARRFG